jgi:energy-coupling factor transport system ATP-binding protein
MVGANGSGKSTLARHLNALLIPKEGHVRVAGKNTRERAHHPEIRRTVGMVFQRPEDQTVATVVEEDVAFGPENLGLDRAEILRRVDEALEVVGLAGERRRPPHMLSAGQMQRLALAGVLAMRPRCIIFDEATAMLDPAGRRAVLALMRDLHREGLTIITITHLMSEALEAERVVVLHRGSVALDHRPAAVFSEVGRLRELGLDLPPSAALAHTLRRQVPSLPANLLTPKDLVTALDALPHDRSSGSSARPNTPKDRAKPASPVIDVRNLSHTYMRNTPFARRALDGVDLDVRTDGAHGLVGATGSGKSTLLQHLNGLLRPQEGRVRVAGYDLSDPDVDVRAVRRQVGLVFQRPEAQIFEQFVGDEIAYGPRLMGLEGNDLREHVAWAMRLVDLDFEAFKDRYTFGLSGGEQRKVALASILALAPDILLLDEPTAGLDPHARSELLSHLHGLREEGMTLVLSSHQMEDIAGLAECMTVMVEGTDAAGGTVSEIFAQSEHLQNWGLEQPAVTRIGEALRARGWPLSPGIVAMDTFVKEIRRALNP